MPAAEAGLSRKSEVCFPACSNVTQILTCLTCKSYRAMTWRFQKSCLDNLTLWHMSGLCLGLLQDFA